MVSQYQGENIVWWSFTEAMKHEPGRGRRLLTGIHHPMSLALACFPNNKSWLSQQLNCLSICRVFVFNFNKVPAHDIPSHFPACIKWKWVTWKDFGGDTERQCALMSCESLMRCLRAPPQLFIVRGYIWGCSYALCSHTSQYPPCWPLTESSDAGDQSSEE